MSYILDALRLSEARRDHRDPALPGLFTAHGPPSRPRRRLWPVAAGVVVASALAVVAVWYGGRGNTDATPAPPEAPPATAPQQAAGTGPDRPPAVSTPKRVEPVADAGPRAVDVRNAGVPAPAPASMTVEVEGGEGAIPAIPVLAPPPPVRFEPPPAPAEPAPTRLAAVMPDEGGSAPAVAPLPLASEDRGSVDPAFPDVLPLEPPADTALDPVVLSAPAITELAPSARAQLPDIVISMHSHVVDAARRFVRVNGRMVREGDFVEERLQAIRITPDGVVFRHEDQDFFVSRDATWRRPTLGRNR